MALVTDCVVAADRVQAAQPEISTISREAATKAQYRCPASLEGDMKPGKCRREDRKKLHSIHSYVARTGAVAMAASASIITRQVEQFAVAEGKRPCSITFQRSLPISAILERILTQTVACLSGIVAQCKHLVAVMANTIGEPPHRPFSDSALAEEQEAPLSLFWALNLCTVCSLASLVLLAAFWPGVASDSYGSSDGAEQGTDECWIPGVGAAFCAANREYTIMRVLAVVALSLVSGLCLGWRHPLQSGLLCGI